MANATATRLGANLQGGDKTALFLKVFAGEVLTAYETATIMEDKHQVRTIPHGKSASFPVTGKVSASYHVPGTEIVGQNTNLTEKVIAIDSLLITDVFLANIDEAMNHFDVRSIYSTEMGRKLAKTRDEHVLIELLKAARSAANISGETGAGSTIIDVNMGSATLATRASALAAALFAAAQKLDENDIPEDNRFAVFAPGDYYALVQNTDAINSLWGGLGAYSDGKIWRIAGITILKSNLIPKGAAVNAGTGLYVNHSVDTIHTAAEVVKGLVWHPSAVGTVKLMDLGMEMQYDIRRQGTLMVAKYAVGHGVLRPECAIELATINATAG